MNTKNEWYDSPTELYEIGCMLAEVYCWTVDDILRFIEKPWKWTHERAAWIALGRPDPKTLTTEQLEAIEYP